jgi:hypothetical protein
MIEIKGAAITANDNTSVGLKMSTPASLTFEFASGSGISTQAGGTLTITKKIAIKDDAGNTIYIPCGTIA